MVVMKKNSPLLVIALFANFLFLPAHADDVGNRFTYLEERNPFYAGEKTPKLTTPMWFGEDGVEAVVILSIDDLRVPRMEQYRDYLAPILARLAEIDGKSQLSVFTNTVDASHPQVQTWLKQGVWLDVHTVTHPCPLLRSGFDAAVTEVADCIDNLSRIPNNQPIAYRMPCCDSINSASPRFFSEILLQKTSEGGFLRADSSILMFPDASYAAFAPFENYATTSTGYPYPYVINDLVWEFPIICPTDWQGKTRYADYSPKMIAALKRGLDQVIAAQGAYTFCFHPHGWIKNSQVVEMIDHVVEGYGSTVRFIHFEEALRRMEKHLLGGISLRNTSGGDAGIRLVDVNHDGYLDVIVANETRKETRIWKPESRVWEIRDFPFTIVSSNRHGQRVSTGVRFGVFQKNGFASALVANSRERALAHFGPDGWKLDDKVDLAKLESAGLPVLTARDGEDRGTRLRDVDGDGFTDVIVNNEAQNAIFRWNDSQHRFDLFPFALPRFRCVVDEKGRDHGLRFVDVDRDGHDDVILSNDEEYFLYLYADATHGWSDRVLHGPANFVGALPRIVSDGRDHGAWFTEDAMYVANESTAQMEDLVDVRSFDALLEHRASTPTKPQDTLKHFRLPSGFRIELVASEPDVLDPVSMEFDSDGKIWVAEMGSYPTGEGRDADGRVRTLRDTDGDGRVDESIVFATGLTFPSGVLPYKRGVLVTCAPDIYYLEDTNGDGRADVREVVFTGFGEENHQHRVNGLHYALDNWIYGANGDSNGDISIAASPDVEPVSISGRDFRFTRDLKRFEPVTGRTQYGLTMDDFGNRFGASNSHHLMHYVLPERYIRRNPFYSPPRPVLDIPEHGAMAEIRQISRQLVSLNSVHRPGHFSSACGVTVYRGEMFPDSFRGNSFVCEPVGNVIHRDVLHPSGATFTAQRGSSDSEFLASTDSWFRPVYVTTGPDDALYVVDMYRYVIEHPRYIPKHLQQVLDVTAGRDRGRIYRITYGSQPDDRSAGLHPDLSNASTSRLARLLEHPNGWWRDTAQRLVVDRGDASAGPELRKLLRAPDPRTRVHSLWTLEALGLLGNDSILAALDDSDPNVREHALRLAETRLDDHSDLRSRVLRLAADTAARVVFQTALTLGEVRDGAAALALAKILRSHLSDTWVRAAVLTSSRNHAAQVLTELLAGDKAGLGNTEARETIAALAEIIARDGTEAQIRQLLDQLAPIEPIEQWQSAFLGALYQSPRGAAVLRRVASGLEKSKWATWIGMIHVNSRAVALDRKSAVAARIEAVEALATTLVNDDQATETLLTALEPLDLQLAVVRTLRRNLSNSEGQAERALIRGWSSASPTSRSEILAALLSNSSSSLVLLDAVKSKALTAQELGPAATERLRSSESPAVKNRATKLLTSSPSVDMEELIKRYAQEANQINGNRGQGARLFKKHCATCHRHCDNGFEVGPGFEQMRGKPTIAFVEAILNPQRMVAPSYAPYTVQLKSGDVQSGIISNESATAITVLRAGAVKETILRQDILQVSATGGSLMPGNLHEVLKPEDVAHLIKYVRECRSRASR